MKLTMDQRAALADYIEMHGRCWKSHLRQTWMTGIYESYDHSAQMQQIRNSFGPSWLVRFNLKSFRAGSY